MLHILWERKDRFEYDHKQCHQDNCLPSCEEQSDCRSIHLGGNPVMAEWSSFPSTNILFQESLYDPLPKAVQSGVSTASISSQGRMTVQWWCRALRQVGYSEICSFKGHSGRVTSLSFSPVPGAYCFASGSRLILSEYEHWMVNQSFIMVIQVWDSRSALLPSTRICGFLSLLFTLRN